MGRRKVAPGGAIAAGLHQTVGCLTTSSPSSLPRSVCITGGSGALGHALVAAWLGKVERIVVLSRGEWRQAQMAATFGRHPSLRFFIGDVRDEARLRLAFRGVDTVVHAAALKRLDDVAYDPLEVYRTNVQGTEYVLSAARHERVGRVLAISSDKATSASTAYGATKFMAEQLAVTANVYGYPMGTRSAALRYGNVLNSTGSIVPLWREQVAAGQPITITDPRMTRFMITLSEAVSLVERALACMQGGEVFVPLLPSANIMHIADAVAPRHPLKSIGLRPGGEKLHEALLSDREIEHTVWLESVGVLSASAGVGEPGWYEPWMFVIRPTLHPWRAEFPWADGKPADFLPADGERYTSDSRRVRRMSVEEIRAMVET